MALNHSTGYYAEPYSLDSLSSEVKGGLIAIGILAMISILLTFTVICLLVGRFVAWGKNLKDKIDQNQFILLVFNLLIADFFQSMAFVLSFQWIQLGGIFAPSATCYVQAGFLHIGDLASGFFVMSMALNTVYILYKDKTMPLHAMIASIGAIWAFSFMLTLIGPLQHGPDFFVRAGNWVRFLNSDLEWHLAYFN